MTLSLCMFYLPGTLSAKCSGFYLQPTDMESWAWGDYISDTRYVEPPARERAELVWMDPSTPA